MPELPEVETIARELAQRLRGAKVTSVEVSGLPLRMRRPVDRAGIEAAVVGHEITAIERRAKYLLLHFTSAKVILVHLGMSGRLELRPAKDPRPPHTHCVLLLGAAGELRFIDPRRFGMIAAYAVSSLASAPELASLGPDPLAPEFSSERLLATLRATRGCDLKAFLLDQKRLSGVGNIYACEALFEAGLHPRARAQRLSGERAVRLHAAIGRVLRAAVENRGTTFRDYVDASGRAGDNQSKLQVFMREGQPCPRCGERIRRIVQAARSTFFCPRCQRR